MEEYFWNVSIHFQNLMWLHSAHIFVQATNKESKFGFWQSLLYVKGVLKSATIHEDHYQRHVVQTRQAIPKIVVGLSRNFNLGFNSAMLLVHHPRYYFQFQHGYLKWRELIKIHEFLGVSCSPIFLGWLNYDMHLLPYAWDTWIKIVWELLKPRYCDSWSCRKVPKCPKGNAWETLLGEGQKWCAMCNAIKHSTDPLECHNDTAILIEDDTSRNLGCESDTKKCLITNDRTASTVGEGSTCSCIHSTNSTTLVHDLNYHVWDLSKHLTTNPNEFKSNEQHWFKLQ